MIPSLSLLPPGRQQTRQPYLLLPTLRASNCPSLRCRTSRKLTPWSWSLQSTWKGNIKQKAVQLRNRNYFKTAKRRVFQNGVPASAEQQSGDLNGVGLVLLLVVVSSWTLNEERAGGGEAVLPETHGRKAAS